MGKNKRKYYVSEHGSVRKLNQKTFLVYWNDNSKRKHSTSSGPYSDFKEAEKIMISHLINGVCSWIVSYNG
tara:strand:- start:218 stop:430 length:213 start_codon:yes stop_codon:yes gene_type:complete